MLPTAAQTPWLGVLTEMMVSSEWMAVAVTDAAFPTSQMLVFEQGSLTPILSAVSASLYYWSPPSVKK